MFFFFENEILESSTGSTLPSIALFNHDEYYVPPTSAAWAVYPEYTVSRYSGHPYFQFNSTSSIKYIGGSPRNYLITSSCSRRNTFSAIRGRVSLNGSPITNWGGANLGGAESLSVIQSLEFDDIILFEYSSPGNQPLNSIQFTLLEIAPF